MKKENQEVILEGISNKFRSSKGMQYFAVRSVSKVARPMNASTSLISRWFNKKIDAVAEKLSKKIDAVSVDLSAHRADTEAHHGVYRVKER